ncbi:MAG: RdgB/HAM1 family non-canonical purine NTP pyrophosphatase [Aestuariivita sp.]|nr:RdgB/HAM1 family non-canonical purine NTP pyrophosphatase [Aestuariivita sp.]MCY4347376.1 RdgB/HAM1 family non-canonical purine NTP pyrophosphatase [Aestuariivita sp.]
MTRRLARERLIVATHNLGKLAEFHQLLSPASVTAIGVREFGLAEPEETATTYEGNARIKAQAAAYATQLPALADDSGIEIFALDGAPGVYTADWATTPNGRDFCVAMERANQEVEAISAPHPRHARFVCCLVLAWPDGHCEVFEGFVAGQLVWPMRGILGHGFDPIFMPDGHTRTFAQMTAPEKNALSHRARAVEQLIENCFA